MNDELEAELHNDLMHTLKLVPQSQRELFVSELAKYISSRDQQIALAAQEAAFNHAKLLVELSSDNLAYAVQQMNSGSMRITPSGKLLRLELATLKSKQEKV